MSKFRGQSALFKKNFYLKMKDKSLSEIKDIKSNIDLKIDQKWYIYELLMEQNKKKNLQEQDFLVMKMEDRLNPNNFDLNEKDENKLKLYQNVFESLFVYYTIKRGNEKSIIPYTIETDKFQKVLILAFYYWNKMNNVNVIDNYNSGYYDKNYGEITLYNPFSYIKSRLKSVIPSARLTELRYKKNDISLIKPYKCYYIYIYWAFIYEIYHAKKAFFKNVKSELLSTRINDDKVLNDISEDIEIEVDKLEGVIYQEIDSLSVNFEIYQTKKKIIYVYKKETVIAKLAQKLIVTLGKKLNISNVHFNINMEQLENQKFKEALHVIIHDFSVSIPDPTQGSMKNVHTPIIESITNIKTREEIEAFIKIFLLLRK